MTDDVRRMAVIDVGTNSVRLFAVEIGGEEFLTLDDYGAVTRLGAALVRDGSIAPDDEARTLEALETCLARAEALDIREIDIAGTEVFRAAANGGDVAARFSRTLGRMVRILSPDDEAEASYLGVVGWEETQDPGAALIIDVGGGSTEIVVGEGVALQGAASAPVGALRVTEEHFNSDPPARRDLDAARKAIDRTLDGLKGFARRIPRGIRAVAVGGTACAIGAWAAGIVPYDPQRVHGVEVDAARLEAVIAEWAGLDLAARMERGRMGEGRARVVLGGALVFERVGKRLDLPSFRVSTRGLRHGLILRRLLLA